MVAKLKSCYRKILIKYKLQKWINDINNNKFNFIFIHINKTAGISIQNALNSPKQAHMLAWHVYKKVDPNRWNTCFQFAFVRNPWDRAVSDYFYRCKGNQHNLKHSPISFEEWINKTYVECDPFFHNRRYNFIPQIEWLTDPSGKILVDFIGKFENLETDFKYICKKININEVKLPHKNKTIRKNYREYYNENTKNIIADWYKKDIDYFKYKF